MQKIVNHVPDLLSLRDLIKMYRLEARRVLSQNYLMDMNLTKKIVRKAGNLVDKYVLEVGPGPGGITRAILETPCRRLDVVEIYRRFIPALEHLQSNDKMGRLHIHNENILKTEIEPIWENAGLKILPWLNNDLPSAHIIGNLPFNIATPLLIRFLRDISERRGPWSFGRVPLTLTFQSEVARRIVGEIDSETRSRIGVMAQYLTTPKLLFEIPGKNFVPSPEVNVGVVTFVPRQDPLIHLPFSLVDKVVRQAFHLRNKYVIKSFQTLYPKDVSLELAHDLLKHCRVDPKTLSARIGIEDFADICQYYNEQCKTYPGLFLYERCRPLNTMEILKDDPSPFPPEYKFSSALNLREGISLAQFDKNFQ